MKISKRTRDGAILICAIAASTPSITAPISAADEIGLYGAPADHLATAAWYAADKRLGCGQESFAEAEALLRCGFTP